MMPHRPSTPRLFVRLQVLLLVSIFLSSYHIAAVVGRQTSTTTSGSGATCMTSADCSYNGECSPVDHVCVCDRAWRGPQCSRLNLQPIRPGTGLNTTSDGGQADMSWGGTVNAGDHGGKWHMHAAQFVK